MSRYEGLSKKVSVPQVRFQFPSGIAIDEKVKKAFEVIRRRK